VSGIVCAIRGGPGSRATVAQAIALARDTGLPLHFLYVVNQDFLFGTGHSPIPVLVERMRHMGESALSAACALASAQGVTAQEMVRYGHVESEIVDLCRESGANYLVLGWPLNGDRENVFTQEFLKQFIQRIEKRIGVQVVLPSRDVKRDN